MSTKKKNRNKKPVRLCVCCGQQKSKSEMMRILMSGRNTTVEKGVIDSTGREHGRGAYICRNKKCIIKGYEEGLIDEDVRDSALAELEKYKLQLLSIAMKAGKLSSGEYQCEEAVKKGTACILIIAEDASENTQNKFISKCEFYEIPYVTFSDKETLGHMIGKNERSVVAINDMEFSAQFYALFGGNE